MSGLAGASSCYLEMFGKLWKWVCRTVGPSFAVSSEPLAYRRNIASLSFFYMYQCSYELAELLPLPHSRGRSTRYSNRMHNFSITISSCYKDVYVNSFFPRNTRSLNFTRLIWLIFSGVMFHSCFFGYGRK